MADRKISDLTALTTPASGDYLPIVDISEASAANKNKRITIEELLRGAPDGTAGAPGFAFESDPDSGLYSTGANGVALSTGGTGRLFIDASGNVNIDSNTFYVDAVNNRVAIGINNPLQLLHLSSNNPPITQITYQGVGAAQTGVVAGGAYTIGVDGGNGSTERLRITSTGQLSHIGAGSTGSPAVSFNGSAPSNSLVITSAGLVGIGTSSPDSTLHIATTASSTVPGFRLSSSGSLANNDIFRVQINGLTNGFRMFQDASSNVRYTFEGGSVGIGTTSPGTTLDVAGTIRANTAVVTSLTNGILQSREFGGNSANNTIEYSIRPATGKSGYLTFTEDAVADRWSIGIQNGSDALRFISGTPTTGTEAARIDSSGRLLVGTSSYSGVHKLVVRARTDDANNNAGLVLQRGQTPTAPDQPVGAIFFEDASSNSGASIIAFSDGGAWTSGSNHRSRLVFSTTADGASSPTERMRIGSSGTARLFTSDYGLLLGNSQSAGTTYTALEIYAGSTSTTSLGTLTLQIYNNGNVQNTNNSYGAISDLKLKENIVDANSQWDDIKALQVRNYNFKEGQTHTQIGLVAQEVELVSPGLVSESPDRDAEGNDLGTVTKSINYSVLYMKAVKALQEAMERIETLEAKVAALEGA